MLDTIAVEYTAGGQEFDITFASSADAAYGPGDAVVSHLHISPEAISNSGGSLRVQNLSPDGTVLDESPMNAVAPGKHRLSSRPRGRPWPPPSTTPTSNTSSARLSRGKYRHLPGVLPGLAGGRLVIRTASAGDDTVEVDGTGTSLSVVLTAQGEKRSPGPPRPPPRWWSPTAARQGLDQSAVTSSLFVKAGAGATLSKAAGATTVLDGGAGDDTYEFGAGAAGTDRVVEGANADTDTLDFKWDVRPGGDRTRSRRQY